MAEFKIYSLNKEIEELSQVHHLSYNLGSAGVRRMRPKLVAIIRAPNEKRVILSVAYDFSSIIN